MMKNARALLRGWKFLSFFAVFWSVSSHPAYGIISPKEGSGAVIPLTPEEMIQRNIGQPAPPLPRFLTVDRSDRTVMKVGGTYPVPVLLGEFSNVSHLFPRDDYQTFLFDGPWPTGTMTDYYHEISYNQFTVTGTVDGWFTLPNSNVYYQGGSNGFGSYPTNAGGFVYDLLTMADPEVDFSVYDNDGPDGIPNSGDDDGYVDALFAVHAGEGGECGGPWLWSHRSSLWGMGAPIFTTNDIRFGGGNIKVNDYIMMPALSCGGATLIEIGVFAHEFGHSLNLPDLYDGDGSSEGIGGWGLMGSGSWGGDQRSPETPSHMCAWSKERLGWVEPQEVPRNFQNVELPRVEDNPFVLKVWRDGDVSGPQYFLIENRQKVGFDESLLNSGLLIWHIDNSMPGNWNENHYLVDLEEADGEYDLDHGSDRGDPGDPFPGVEENRFFNWATVPNSQDYLGDTTQVAVNEISDPDSVMTVGLLTVQYPIVEFLSYRIDDSSTGDNDGVVDVGETVDVTFSVHNHSSVAAESVWASIRSSDPTVSFTTDSVFLGTIASNGDADNTGQPFTMVVDAGAEVHSSEFTIELSGIGVFYFAHSEEFLIGHPTLLLVMDDEEDDYAAYYRGALDTLGVPYAIRDVYQSGSPSDSLHPFETVIWFTGRATTNTINAVEQDSLRSFIERGGGLFLSGQNIAEDLSVNGPDFLEEVLGVSYDRNIMDPILNGVQSNQVGAGLSMIVTSGSRGANNQTSRDVLTRLIGTQAAVVYDTTTGDVAGVTRHTEQTDGRVVFFGFGFEAINRSNPADTVQATRREVMENILNFLTGTVGLGESDGGGDPALPRAFALSQNYPNPFNPMTTISFTVPERRKVFLDVYDLRGRSVRNLIDRLLEPGYYAVQWDGKDDEGRPMSSGVYLYRLRAGEEVVTRRMLLVK